MENDPKLVVDRGTVITLLIEKFGMSLEDSIQWFNTPNVYFKGWTPDDVLRNTGVETIFEALEVAWQALLDDMKRNEEQGEHGDEQ